MIPKLKIGIVGAGTSGILVAGLLSEHKSNTITPFKSNVPKISTLFSVDLVLDPNIPIIGVGESSTVHFVRELFQSFGFSVSENAHQIKCTPKFSIKYENFNPDGSSFHHPFDGGTHGVHFNSKYLSEWALSRLKCNIIESHVEDIEKFSRDYDYVFDCRGFPEDYDEYTHLEYVPVNSVLLYKSPKREQFQHTRTIAHENGWCFVVPLTDETSYGYLYNKDITTEEEAELGFHQLLFEEAGLGDEPEFVEFKKIKFSNYYHENAFSGNIFKMGFRASFVEPMESTANDVTIRFASRAMGVMTKWVDPEVYNKQFKLTVLQVERFILWHYLAGSTFDTPFWHYAIARAKDCLYGSVRHKDLRGDLLFKDKEFENMIQISKGWEDGLAESLTYGFWGTHSLYRTGKGLGFF